MSEDGEDLGFAYRATKDGEIAIRRAGRTVTVLRGAAARDFAAEVAGMDAADAQQLMARVTGNYKRGNERAAANHPRNRRPRRALTSLRTGNLRT